MIRLRYPLQLLLLAATAAADSPHVAPIDPAGECGILKFCIVHNTCLGLAELGWTKIENNNYSKPAELRPGPISNTCMKYITISPLLGGSSVQIRMVDEGVLKQLGLRLYFGAKPSSELVHPHIFCEENIGDLKQDLNLLGFKINQDGPSKKLRNAYPNVFCEFEISISDATDIRQKITDAANSIFEIEAVGDADASGKPNKYTVKDASLYRIRIPCKDLSVLPKMFVDTVDLDEDKPEDSAGLRPTTTKYNQGSTIMNNWLDDNEKVQCPPDYPMHHKKKDFNSPFEYVKDGLVCKRGYLMHWHDESKKVETGDMIKCARKKCSYCAKPSIMKGEDTAAATFDEALEGNRCRTITCQSQLMMLRLKDNADPVKIHKQSTLICSDREDGKDEKDGKWQIDGGEKKVVTEVVCMKDVYCTKLHPLNVGVCEEGDENCAKAVILDKYDRSNPCEKEFDLIYIVPHSGNKILLDTISFKCDYNTGKWLATTKENGDVKIEDNSTMTCMKNWRKNKLEEEKKEAEPFVGSRDFIILIVGLSLLVVAAIVFGVFCTLRTKRKKAARKKEMASVSQTYKEPPKYKKGSKKSKKSKRKERQVSAVNSVTGTISGPNSGPGSQSGSAPIAPPSTLLTPSKGISKPDKGCAVLDLTTGQSKNLKWTNHTGDGPPSQRQSWASSHSKQENIDSAPIKFAPGELEAAKRANEWKLKKKEKSRQNSAEYNLGDPKPLGDEEWKKVRAKLGEPSGGVDDSTLKM